MPALPSSLTAILSLLRPAFTAPTFQTFEALVAGFLGRVGEHTVCGMWQAARLAGKLHHSRAHDFFARSAWCPDRLGLLVLDFLLERFVDAEEPICLAVDGSVFRRSGPKVHGASWHHDSSAASGGRGFKFGNCFVVVGLVVRVGALGERAWCLPVLFRLWLPTPKPTKERPDPERRPSQQDLAAALVGLIAERHPQRRIDVLGDSAFACKAMAPPSDRITLTSRLRSNALITTDVEAEVAEIVARYADRWSIEVAFQDAKQTVGVGEARNRVGPAVERTVPFGLLCQSLAVAWYALNADPAADVNRRRREAPWYSQKRDPSMLDMLCALRRELIRAEFRQTAGRAPSPRQITARLSSRLRAAA
jgi:DDE superfamily endonuclease